MFEHLDDPSAPRSTDPHLAAVRGRARAVVAQRRKTRLATGSVALAATAGVAAVATVGLPGGNAGAASPGGVTLGASASATAPASPTAAAVPSLVAVPSAAVSPPTVTASPTPTVPPSISPTPYGSLTSSPTPTRTAATAPPSATVSVDPGAPTVSPTVSPVPVGSAAPTTAAAPTTRPSAVTAACTAEAARLKTSVEGAGYVSADPGSDVIAWSHPAGPLTSLVVGVQCSPFSPDQVSPNSPVQEFTVEGFHSWVLGDVSSGKLDLVWNSQTGVEVHVIAGFAPGTDPVAVTKELLRFGNTLVD